MWFKYFLISFIVITSILRILIIGEDREPITPGIAASDLIFNTLMIIGIIYYF